MFPAKDISKYQGAWQDTGEPIVIMKISGGDAGLYYDGSASSNYSSAVAAGKHVGGYHFIGWTAGAVQEASFFVRGMAPKVENDVYALDVENGQVSIPANAPQYVLDMVNYIHSQTGVYPIIYMSLSTLNAHDWSAVLALCGLWLADWNGNPSGTIPTTSTYIMQQYADGPNYDHDEYFGPSLESFDNFGYKAAKDPTTQAAPAPTPVPETTTTTTTQAPAPPVEATTTTTTLGAPVISTTSTQPQTATTTSTTTSQNQPAVTKVPVQSGPVGFWTRVDQFILAILKGLIGRK